MKSSFVFFAILICFSSVHAGADWDSETDLEPLYSLSHYADGSNREHPKDNDESADRTVYISTTTPFEFSALVIERNTIGTFTCEKVRIDLVVMQDIDDVITTIEPYSTATPPTDVGENWHFIDKHQFSHGDMDKDDIVKVKSKHYDEFDSKKGIFLGPNHVYKVTASYLDSNNVRHYVVFWLEEDTSTTDVKRWDIIYDPTATQTTSFEAAGYVSTDANENDYTDETIEPPSNDETSKLFNNLVVTLFVNGFIGFVFLKLGYMFFVSFDNAITRISSLLVMWVGITSIATSLDCAMGLLTGKFLGQIVESQLGIDSDIVKWSFNPVGNLIETTTGIDLSPGW